MRIFCRSKTVEKPGVNARIKLRQLFQHIANQQGESYSPIGQGQGLKAGMNRIIRRQQLFAVRGEFGPQGERALQVVAGQRVFFDADEVQACIRVCDLIKQLPGAQKIQSCAEAGFTDNQLAVGGQGRETLLQGILLNKHISGFFETGLVRKIHVIKHPRMGATLVIPVNLGIGHFSSHVRLGNGKAAILADQQQRD